MDILYFIYSMFIQSAGDIKAPTKATGIVAAMGELFDAITELDDEETDLIKQCSPDTAQALLNVVIMNTLLYVQAKQKKFVCFRLHPEKKIG